MQANGAKCERARDPLTRRADIGNDSARSRDPGRRHRNAVGKRQRIYVVCERMPTGEEGPEAREGPSQAGAQVNQATIPDQRERAVMSAGGWGGISGGSKRVDLREVSGLDRLLLVFCCMYVEPRETCAAVQPREACMY